MDRKYIDDNHIVARYLADELSDAERDAFEEYYVEDPEIVKDLEAAARFKAGLSHAQRHQALAALLEPRPRYREPTRPLLAIAASVLMAIGIAFFGFGYPPFQPVLVAEQGAIRNWRGALPLADYRLVTKVRGTSDATEIELPASPQVLELRLLLGSTGPSPPYRATLNCGSDGATQIVATLDGLPRTQAGFVQVFINSTRLTTGRCGLQIAGSDQAQAEFQLAFRRPS